MFNLKILILTQMNHARLTFDYAIITQNDEVELCGIKNRLLTVEIGY
jgi:hypothetical protein